MTMNNLPNVAPKYGTQLVTVTQTLTDMECLEVPSPAASKFMSSLLQEATSIHLDESQTQQLDQVLKNQPAKSGLGELNAALVRYEALAPFRTALLKASNQGRFGALFEGADSAENIVGQAQTHVFLKDTE